MKVKLDENLGRRGLAILLRHGHDVATVAEQGMCTFADGLLIEACRSEERCLVTLDTDFSNPLVYPPGEYNGLAVIRLPRRGEPGERDAAFETLGTALTVRPIRGRLWIVQSGRIREYIPEA